MKCSLAILVLEISALSNKVECGPLVGRPFGGVFTMIKSCLLSVTKCIHVAERFVIVRVGDVLLVNVYLPSVGTVDRDIIINDILLEICTFKEQYDNCGCILAGDFNNDLDKNTSIKRNKSLPRGQQFLTMRLVKSRFYSLYLCQ
jgi:hypothetical protein